MFERYSWSMIVGQLLTSNNICFFEIILSLEAVLNYNMCIWHVFDSSNWSA